MTSTEQPGKTPASPPPSATDMPPLFTSSSPPSFAVNPSAPSALARLTLTDKLLLAQVVHHLAESPPNWASVSNLVLSHPLVKNPSRIKAAADAGLSLARIFGTRECERAWTALMRHYNLVVPSGEDDASGQGNATKNENGPPTPRLKEAKGAQPRTDRKSQLALAQILYAERMEELRDSIKKKEEEFKALIDRIDQIKSGQADQQLEEEFNKEVASAKAQPATPAESQTRRTSASASTPTRRRSSAATSVAGAAASTPASDNKKEAEAVADDADANANANARTATAAAAASDDQMDVEDVLGGRTKEQETREGKGSEEMKDDADKEAEGGDDDAGDTANEAEASASGSTSTLTDVNSRRSKRKRADTDADATVDDATMAADEGATTATDDGRDAITASATGATRDAKRTRPSRPSVTPRRSRRGTNKDADEDGDEDGGGGGGDDSATVDDSSDAAPAFKSSKAAGPRRSLRGRASTHSREPSTSVRDDDDEEGGGGGGDDGDGDETPKPSASGADADAEVDASVDADADRDASSSSNVRRSKRESAMNASSSSTHALTRRGSSRESTATREQREKEREKRRKANEKVLMQIWTEVSAHTHGNLFQNVVKESVSWRCRENIVALCAEPFFYHSTPF